jgi:hypothetical protein
VLAPSSLRLRAALGLAKLGDVELRDRPADLIASGQRTSQVFHRDRRSAPNKERCVVNVVEYYLLILFRGDDVI